MTTDMVITLTAGKDIEKLNCLCIGGKQSCVGGWNANAADNLKNSSAIS